MWNSHFVKNPDTGKRVARIDPPEDWIVAQVPELRIVGNALWQAAKARQGEISERYATAIAVEHIRDRFASMSERPGAANRAMPVLAMMLAGCRFGEVASLEWDWNKGKRIFAPDSKPGLDAAGAAVHKTTARHRSCIATSAGASTPRDEMSVAVTASPLEWPSGTTP